MRTLFLLVVALAVLSVEGKWWMEQPYGDDEFNVRVEYGDDINVTCEDPRIDGKNYTVDYWVIPDLTLMEAGFYKDFVTVDGRAGWEVSADTEQIRLFIITENHFGFYHCLVTLNDTNERIMVKRGVNYKGPYFDDLWDDYRLNTIVGLSSSIIFLCIAGAIYGLSTWWEIRKGVGAISPIDGDDDASSLEEKMEKPTHTNEFEGYTNEMVGPEVIEEQQSATAETPI